MNKYFSYLRYTAFPLVLVVCAVLLTANALAAETKKADAKQAEIQTRDSSKDEGLNKLKSKIYTSPKDKENAAKAKKAAEFEAKKNAAITGAAGEDKKKILDALVSMSPEDLETIKKNLISKTRQNTSLAAAEKEKIIDETTRFYDKLKAMDSEARRNFVATLQ